MSQAEALAAYLQPLLPAYLEELRQLSAIECPSAFPPGVNEAGDWVHKWAGQRGWTVQVWPETVTGNNLAVSASGGNPDGIRALLAAHLDAVYPVGVAAERPMTINGDIVLGPGTADNKSGLLSGLYAMAALQDLGFLKQFAGITLVAGADEETDMRTSGAVLTELAPQYDLALVLEAGRENGDIVSARKGSGHFSLTVLGKAAHAGVEPHKGANAILALSQQIVALQLLNGMRPGTTVNVGVIAGGTVSNTVADLARAEIDVRVVLPEDMQPVGEAVEAITLHPYVHGTKAVLEGGWRQPPMAKTPQITALADLARNAAQELGFSVNDVATGGISYANLLASLGLPVLDGLGPVGGLDHSPDEYILASSIVPRTALLALLLLRRAELGR